MGRPLSAGPLKSLACSPRSSKLPCSAAVAWDGAGRETTSKGTDQASLLHGDPRPSSMSLPSLGARRRPKSAILNLKRSSMLKRVKQKEKRTRNLMSTSSHPHRLRSAQDHARGPPKGRARQRIERKDLGGKLDRQPRPLKAVPAMIHQRQELVARLFAIAERPHHRAGHRDRTSAREGK